jgi:hypothetical protein
MALAAMAWVTTEQELKLVVVVVVALVVTGAVADALALVAGDELDDVEVDELHPVRRMAAATASTIATLPGRNIECSLIRPLGRQEHAVYAEVQCLGTLLLVEHQEGWLLICSPHLGIGKNSGRSAMAGPLEPLPE